MKRVSLHPYFKHGETESWLAYAAFTVSQKRWRLDPGPVRAVLFSTRITMRGNSFRLLWGVPVEQQALTLTELRNPPPSSEAPPRSLNIWLSGNASSRAARLSPDGGGSLVQVGSTCFGDCCLEPTLVCFFLSLIEYFGKSIKMSCSYYFF